MSDSAPGAASDTRLVPAAAAGWAGAFLGTAGAATATDPDLSPGGLVTSAAVVAAVALLGAVAAVAVQVGPARRRRTGFPLRRAALVAGLALVVGVGALAAGHGRVVAQSSGPVVELAAQRAVVQVRLSVTSDPVPRHRSAGTASWQAEQVRLAADVTQVDVGGTHSPPERIATSVLVIAPTSWADLRIGDVVVASGRLGLPSQPGPAAAVLLAEGETRLERHLVSPWTVGDPPRAALREAVAGLPDGPAGLLPSLVVGDESLLTGEVREQLRVTGLAHLTAVSGANVAIVLGAVVLAARWLGVRGFWLPVVGLLAIVGFVAMARPEPSVVRAAAMGSVVVLGLVGGGRRRAGAGRGIAPLAVAATVLLLFDPWLARSTGFALSCAATAGIIVLARPWARAAAGWMPRALAAALSVPLAAQLACTPLLVGMSGELSLSALPANLLAAPAVAPATVLGIIAALVGVLIPDAAHILAAVAMVPTGWIVLVASWAAALPGTVVAWTWGAGVAAFCCVALVAAMPFVLASPVASVVSCAALVALIVRPTAGWPPPDWSFVACDVGQGDALVLRAGPSEAVVVDVGPDPGLLASCLDDLGVDTVPVVMISHFHADHRSGLAALDGRQVRQVVVGVLDEPEEGAAMVRNWAAARSLPVQRARTGQRGSWGEVSWRVLWPSRVIRGVGSTPNQASVVVRVELDGMSVLLTGDLEPAAQQAVLVESPRLLDVDVLKVPHHGSPEQHDAFLQATTPALAVVPVGEVNDYGHPAASTLRTLRGTGAVVVRTDIDGDIALVGSTDARRLGVVRRGQQ